MKRIIIIVALGALAFFALSYGCSKRNSFVDLNENVISQWHQVESQYQRRLDLIPNIVKTVETEANFEKSTLIGVVEARAKATQVTIDPSNMTPEKMNQFKQVQGELSSAISRLLVVSENYPNLKTSQAFSELRVELEGCENRIAVERMKYNEVVREFNASIKKIPGSLFAWGYKDATYFESDAGAEKAPKVEMNIK
ncbi:MAG: LemA family protein [Burkholderiales bacterium]|nr:LemA family protein [Bacteroidia bacterium]